MHTSFCIPSAFRRLPSCIQCLPSLNWNTEATERITSDAPAGRNHAHELESTAASDQVLRAALELKTRGWTAIEDVIPEDECNAYIQNVWDWLESLGTGVKRDDPATWNDNQWAPVWGNRTGILKCLEVSHQDFVWRMRSDPRITGIFAALWGTDALLSSFDSINVMRPPSITHPAAPVGGSGKQQGWWHTDQAPSKSGVHCIQGLLNLTPCGPHAGTLAVKEGSHAAHETYWAAHPKPAADKAAMDDFHIFTPEEVGYWEQYKTVIVRGYGPGSLFLWDSRTVHQNCTPEDPDLWRHVLYTCYQPASMATADDLRKKREAYEQYLLTTHWPAASVTVNDAPSDEERQQYSLRRTRDKVENDTILKLAGMQPYRMAEERRRRPLLDCSPQELEALLCKAQSRQDAVPV